MMSAFDYANQNVKRFTRELVELLRIPSVSTLPEYRPDVQRAAEWIAADLRTIGMSNVTLYQEEGAQPLVYADWLGAGATAPTILVYCHYDVQPAAMEDGWTSDPFEPVERDGKIYARGAVDSKSHVVAHMKALESLLATGTPPVNIKLLFEGEEESNSEFIFRFVASHYDLLRCDAVVVSDGSLPDINQPVLVYGLRGIVALEVEVRGPARDLHSGHYGGNVHNPIQALMEILAQLHDGENRVTVPGFYDDVRPLDDDEREALRDIESWVEAEWHAVTGAPQPFGEPGYALVERMGARPTLEFNGISGGFTGQGIKTVLPAKATAKMSCRLVPNQQPEHIYILVRDHILRLAPPTVQVDVRLADLGARGVVIDRHTVPMQAAVRAYEAAWGRRPLFTREGGSIPVVAQFQAQLNVPIVLMPFGYKGGGAHGPNEHVYLDMFHKGIQTVLHFVYELAGSSP